MDRSEVDAFEQPVPLLDRQARHLVGCGPDEAVLLQALHQQPEAVALPAQNLDAVALAVAEDVHAGGKGIEPQGLFDEHGQTVDAQPEVDGFAVQVDRQPFVETEHRRPPRMSSTADSAARSQELRSMTIPLGSVACSCIACAEGGVGRATASTGTTGGEGSMARATKALGADTGVSAAAFVVAGGCRIR